MTYNATFDKFPNITEILKINTTEQSKLYSITISRFTLMYSCISVCSNHKYMLSITVIWNRVCHHNLPETKTVCALKLLWWIQSTTKDKILSLTKAFELSFSYMYTRVIYWWSWKASIYNSILQLKRIRYINIFVKSATTLSHGWNQGIQCREYK